MWEAALVPRQRTHKDRGAEAAPTLVRKRHLNPEDSLQICSRVEYFSGTASSGLRKFWPVSQHIPDRGLRFVRIPHEKETAIARKIFRRAGILGDNRSAARKKSRRAIAHPAGLPAHVNAFDSRELAER